MQSNRLRLVVDVLVDRFIDDESDLPVVANRVAQAVAEHLSLSGLPSEAVFNAQSQVSVLAVQVFVPASPICESLSLTGEEVCCGVGSIGASPVLPWVAEHTSGG